MEFVVRYENWTIEDWKKVIWSDETKINRLGSDGRKWCWKERNATLQDHHVEPTLKFGGGSIMIWGCMSYLGVGEMCKIQGIMNGDVYCDILENQLLQTIKNDRRRVQDIVFQQDNDPKHVCKKALDWFDNHHVNVLYWPPNSPDLNPIEHLWDHVKRQLNQYPEPATSIHDLWDRLCKEWFNIPRSVVKSLIESMPRRIQEVKKAKGGYTKY